MDHGLFPVPARFLVLLFRKFGGAVKEQIIHMLLVVAAIVYEFVRFGPPWSTFKEHIWEEAVPWILVLSVVVIWHSIQAALQLSKDLKAESEAAPGFEESRALTSTGKNFQIPKPAQPVRRLPHLQAWGSAACVMLLCIICSYASLIVSMKPSPHPVSATASQPTLSFEPYERANEHLKTPQLLTLYDLFLTDFPVTQGIGGHLEFIKPDRSARLTIEEYVVVDLEKNTKWLKAYIPRYEDTYGVCVTISENSQKQLVDADKFGMSQKPFGGSALHTLKDAVFSKTIFIYHETDLRPEEIGDLTKLFDAKGLHVDFRSDTYLSLKKAGLERQ